MCFQFVKLRNKAYLHNSLYICTYYIYTELQHIATRKLVQSRTLMRDTIQLAFITVDYDCNIHVLMISSILNSNPVINKKCFSHSHLESPLLILRHQWQLSFLNVLYVKGKLSHIAVLQFSNKYIQPRKKSN